jgi:hypothetical protein
MSDPERMSIREDELIDITREPSREYEKKIPRQWETRSREIDPHESETLLVSFFDLAESGHLRHVGRDVEECFIHTGRGHSEVYGRGDLFWRGGAHEL